jgi:hypothetical protein
VVGERYVFYLGHGNLIAWGASRWSRIDASPIPDVTAGEAVDRLYAYMKLTAADRVTLLDKGSLKLIALRSGGVFGAGYSSALVWRVALRVGDEPETWEAQIDAHTGAVRSFTDINAYAQAKGGVYPVSNDQAPPDGVEQAGWPMPYADIAIGASSQTSNASGSFACAPNGSVATTTLSGPYVRVVDACGPVSESVTCDNDLDLESGEGTDCVVPAGSSAGNTHAARTGFYHLNRIAEHGRSWLPSRSWLGQQLTDRVNLNGTCNAFWDGESVSFLKSGDGCNNTGEIAGIFLHEWGHGLDDNDGGGTDNPSEAYADITAFMSTHVSCIGRGFAPEFNCSGYGDVCLNCSGIRDVDYAMHASGTPATPQVFVPTAAASDRRPAGRTSIARGTSQPRRSGISPPAIFPPPGSIRPRPGSSPTSSGTRRDSVPEERL